MAEYIDREATINALDSRDEYDDLVNTIREQPAADVPVKRGEWEKKSSVGVFRCSLCQHIFMLGADEIDEYHFCPNCGARMDGDTK